MIAEALDGEDKGGLRTEMNELDEVKTFVVDDARRNDLPDLQRLLSDTVPECSPQTVWDLPFNWTEYRVIRDDDGSVIAASSLQTLSEDRAEIRGLVVDPEWHGRGLANILIEDLLDQARSEGREVVCVTRKPSFFQRYGFQYTFPTWLAPDRYVCSQAADADPRVYMISCELEPAGSL
jgi:N-acetylglutamate synthase-like GNAT family acetyltransferase